MKTIFLDRDGVINRNIKNGYVKNWDEFEFIPGSISAIRDLTENGYQIFIITNQACINKKIITHDQLAEIHRKMLDQIEKFGGRISEIFYAPNLEEENSIDRKPNPGMLLKAIKNYSVDLSQSFLIGDALTDIAAGKKVGCFTILVRTGRGKNELKKKVKIATPNAIFADLREAVNAIIFQ